MSTAQGAFAMLRKNTPARGGDYKRGDDANQYPDLGSIAVRGMTRTIGDMLRSGLSDPSIKGNIKIWPVHRLREETSTFSNEFVIIPSSSHKYGPWTPSNEPQTQSCALGLPAKYQEVPHYFHVAGSATESTNKGSSEGSAQGIVFDGVREVVVNVGLDPSMHPQYGSMLCVRAPTAAECKKFGDCGLITERYDPTSLSATQAWDATLEYFASQLSIGAQLHMADLVHAPIARFDPNFFEVDHVGGVGGDDDEGGGGGRARERLVDDDDHGLEMAEIPQGRGGEETDDAGYHVLTEDISGAPRRGQRSAREQSFSGLDPTSTFVTDTGHTASSTARLLAPGPGVVHPRAFVSDDIVQNAEDISHSFFETTCQNPKNHAPTNIRFLDSAVRVLTLYEYLKVTHNTSYAKMVLAQKGVVSRAMRYCVATSLTAVVTRTLLGDAGVIVGAPAGVEFNIAKHGRLAGLRQIIHECQGYLIQVSRSYIVGQAYSILRPGQYDIPNQRKLYVRHLMNPKAAQI